MQITIRCSSTYNPKIGSDYKVDPVVEDGHFVYRITRGDEMIEVKIPLNRD